MFSGNRRIGIVLPSRTDFYEGHSLSQRRFVVLDRDGTINVEREYISHPDQIELLPGAAQGLRHLHRLGLGLVVISNQSGIGRGYFSWESLNLIHQRLCELLTAEGIQLDGIYVCPHSPGDGCTCRKPQPELLEKAAREHNFDPRKAFVIGDKKSDIELGQKVSAITLLICTGYDTQLALQLARISDYVIDNLANAAAVIEHLLNKSETS